MKKRFLIYIFTIFLILNLKSAYSEIFIKAKVNNQKSVILWGSGKPLREFLFVLLRLNNIFEAFLFTFLLIFIQDETIRMNIIQRKNCPMIIQEIFPKNDLYAH